MPPRDTPEQIAANTSDLIQYGYANAGPGLWLRPDGYSAASTATALAEVTELMNRTEPDEPPTAT